MMFRIGFGRLHDGVTASLPPLRKRDGLAAGKAIRSRNPGEQTAFCVERFTSANVRSDHSSSSISAFSEIVDGAALGSDDVDLSEVIS